MSAAATYDGHPEYNFRLFGCWDNNIALVSQDSDDIIENHTTNGRVNAVAIAFSYINEDLHHTYFDYFVAGSADDYVYFFTYDFT